MRDSLVELSEALQEGQVASDQLADIYDVVTIGAGPAGTLAANLLARAGLSVLLVDKQALPRYKVCGCCLSSQAVQILKDCGLQQVLPAFAAQPLSRVRLSAGREDLIIPLQDSFALSRSVFDAALSVAAVERGVKLLPLACARIIEPAGKPGTQAAAVSVELELAAGKRNILARVVVMADGIGGTSLQTKGAGSASANQALSVNSGPEQAAWPGQQLGRTPLLPFCRPSLAVPTIVDQLTLQLKAGARLGTGAITNAAPPFYETGCIYMAYDVDGYVGLVRLPDGSTDIAAAFNQAVLRESPAAAVSRLIEKAGWPVPGDLAQLAWKGTVSLTRQRKSVAARRIFVIGDAASYVEPFTGEGIAWALESARQVVPIVLRAVSSWDDLLILDWNRVYKATIKRRQTGTKILAALLRHPLAARAGCDVLKAMPFMVAPVLQLAQGHLQEDIGCLRS